MKKWNVVEDIFLLAVAGSFGVYFVLPIYFSNTQLWQFIAIQQSFLTQLGGRGVKTAYIRTDPWLFLRSASTPGTLLRSPNTFPPSPLSPDTVPENRFLCSLAVGHGWPELPAFAHCLPSDLSFSNNPCVIILSLQSDLICINIFSFSVHVQLLRSFMIATKAFNNPMSGPGFNFASS